MAAVVVADAMASLAPIQPAETDMRLPQRYSYVFGQKIAASMSPLIHGVIYQELGLPWEQYLLDSNDIDHFMRLAQDPKFYGAAVTMPNKLAIMPYLDELTDECQAVGACNTVFIKHGPDGRRLYCGANTDVVGIRESFYQNVSRPDDIFHDRPALVIGGGGAARSAVYALRTWLRATRIYLVNRDTAEVEALVAECRARGFGDGLLHVGTVAQAEALETPGAVVACVPDYPPRTPEEQTARAVTEAMLAKQPQGVVLEMCYNPTPYTELGGIAERAGWRVVLGTEALIWQGLEQDRYWTGLEVKDLPVEKVKEAVAARLSQISRL